MSTFTVKRLDSCSLKVMGIGWRNILFVEYDMVNSDAYKDRLNKIRETQKELIKKDQAVTGNMNWTVNGSKSEGQKMVKDMQKLLLRAFNSECDEVINRVTYANIELSEKRLHSSFEAISKLAEKYDIETVVLDTGVDSPISSHDSDAYKFITKAVTNVFPDVKTTPYIMTAASDSRFMWRISENCLRFAPFSITDEQLEGIHGLNENVDLSALAPAVDFYRYIITNA